MPLPKHISPLLYLLMLALANPNRNQLQTLDCHCHELSHSKLSGLHAQSQHHASSQFLELNLSTTKVSTQGRYLVIILYITISVNLIEDLPEFKTTFRVWPSINSRYRDLLAESTRNKLHFDESTQENYNKTYFGT